MGWPRKDERLRLYFERKNRTYLIVDPDARCHDGTYECLGEVYTTKNPERPSLGSSSVSPDYLRNRCRRKSWNQLPEIWKKEFQSWLTNDAIMYRGLWKSRTENIRNNS